MEVWKYSEDRDKLVCIYKIKTHGSIKTSIVGKESFEADNKIEPLKDIISINGIGR